MVFAVKKFRHHLLGYEFVFHVDHYALQHLVKKADLSGRIARSLSISVNPAVFGRTGCGATHPLHPKCWTLSDSTRRAL
ncbi:hypothetical protein AXG93_512s1000 [Marchantia polymorpha subsp. ruderalis]|uniref:Reverse transcriptase RNase H-like domain-containing protein n=1 Tax=Marchantia polymorpha subsp. ruderalis TaxID=1480154 RepID=A0A176WHZ3_MARPO|nr:hypothetical protein AXG93_512s1000 [Marchantia polymorpha subsp. ruderalis]